MESKKAKSKNSWKMVQKQGGSCFCILWKTGPFFEKRENRNLPNEKWDQKIAQKILENPAVKRPIDNKWKVALEDAIVNYLQIDRQ